MVTGLNAQAEEPELRGERVGDDEVHGAGINEGLRLHGMDLRGVEVAKAGHDPLTHIVQGDLDV
jgi:hypothetical protein